MTYAPGVPNESPTGWDEEAAREWLGGSTSSSSEELLRPWRAAATVIAIEEPTVGTVLDVASGPGGFLQVLLDQFPGARGLWLDFSEVMVEEARSRLAGLGDRVEYHVADLLELDRVCGPESVDVVAASRATHHLTTADLGRFYEQVALVLRPGGWVANWDIVTSGGHWDGLLRAARARLRNDTSCGVGSTHPHTTRRPTVDEHLAAIRAAGLGEPFEAWREFVSVLLLARKP